MQSLFNCITIKHTTTSYAAQDDSFETTNNQIKFWNFTFGGSKLWNEQYQP